jgi:hypothetical protein
VVPSIPQPVAPAACAILHSLENAAKTDTLAQSNWFLMPFSDQAMNTQPCNDCPLNALVATTPAIDTNFAADAVRLRFT